MRVMNIGCFSYELSNALFKGLTYETTSIAWFPTEPTTLIAGQGGKFLKIFDIRDQPGKCTYSN